VAARDRRLGISGKQGDVDRRMLPTHGARVIARLAGTLVEKSPERLVVDVNGVGYEVRVPLSTYAGLPSPGSAVRLLIHTHVREDTLTLYGFDSGRERHLFEKLISVSGVGPKLALALLSGLSAEELSEAIQSGDTQPLGKVPGVGRKTAERLVVDLRDKLGPMSGTAPSESRAGERPEAPSAERVLVADVRSALINLGFSPRDTERALEAARKGLDRQPAAGSAELTFEGLFREALRNASASR